MKIDKIKKYISRFVCKYRGHDWKVYYVDTGVWSKDVAGYCERCGGDTHGKYEQEEEK